MTNTIYENFFSNYSNRLSILLFFWCLYCFYYITHCNRIIVNTHQNCTFDRCKVSKFFIFSFHFSLEQILLLAIKPSNRWEMNKKKRHRKGCWFILKSVIGLDHCLVFVFTNKQTNKQTNTHTSVYFECVNFCFVFTNRNRDSKKNIKTKKFVVAQFQSCSNIIP